MLAVSSLIFPLPTVETPSWTFAPEYNTYKRRWCWDLPNFSLLWQSWKWFGWRRNWKYWFGGLVICWLYLLVCLPMTPIHNWDTPQHSSPRPLDSVPLGEKRPQRPKASDDMTLSLDLEGEMIKQDLVFGLFSCTWVGVLGRQHHKLWSLEAEKEFKNFRHHKVSGLCHLSITIPTTPLHPPLNTACLWSNPAQAGTSLCPFVFVLLVQNSKFQREKMIDQAGPHAQAKSRHTSEIPHIQFQTTQ